MEVLREKCLILITSFSQSASANIMIRGQRLKLVHNFRKLGGYSTSVKETQMKLTLVKVGSRDLRCMCKSPQASAVPHIHPFCPGEKERAEQAEYDKERPIGGNIKDWIREHK